MTVLWLQASSTVLTSPVSMVAHAGTGPRMTPYVCVQRTSQETTVGQVSFTGIRNAVCEDSVSVGMHACLILPEYSANVTRNTLNIRAKN